jgi:sigma-B regulation protein RsbU (phosphoserine phosphatase)
VTDRLGNARLIKHVRNPPLGVMEEKTFAEHTLTLAPGETLFLYTDGITEAANRSGEQFRVQRLMDVAQRYTGQSAQELMLAVIDSVERFSVGTVQADDITCLVVHRNV